jgi:hypothetical protein
MIDTETRPLHNGFPSQDSGLAMIRRMIDTSGMSLGDTTNLYVTTSCRLLCQPVGMVQAAKNRLRYDLQAWWQLVPVRMENNR